VILKLDLENFEQVVSVEDELFIIKFSSPTCGPCTTMIPVMEKLATDNQQIKIYEVNTMESPEIASHFGIRGVPNISYCLSREVIYSFTGITPINDLQYVINNIDDEYFQEHGEFRKKETKKNYWFEASLIFIVLAFILLFLLL
jgi:thioredoxin 1